MLKDLIKIFEKSYKEYGDKIILDRYELKPGLYIKIENNRKFNDQNIMIIKKRDKKVKNIYENQEDEYINKNMELYRWFKHRDYYSNLLDMNKPIDPKKKIHSNNYLTVFIKKETFLESSTANLEERIKNYFDILGNFEEKYSNKKSKVLLKGINSVIDKKKLNKNKLFLIQNLKFITEEIKKKSKEFENYIKIFFDNNQEIEIYKNEYSRYVIPKIFNKNDFNEIVDNEIFGLSNSNMGTNSKKPFLELKSMKCKVPYRITVEEALLLKIFFDWLNFQSQFMLLVPDDFKFNQELSNYIDLEMQPCHYLHLDKGKEVVINDYEFLPGFSRRIGFDLLNVLMVEEGENKTKYIENDRKINRINELEKEVDDIFFNRKLMYNYYSDPKVEIGRLSNNLHNILIISRGAFHDYFWKGNSKNIKEIINQISLEIVKEQIRNVKYASNRLEYYSKFKKAVKAYNLRVSLLNYFNLGGKEMAGRIKEMIAKMKNKISLDCYVDCDTDDEFYFISGQLAYYILSQSEKSNKNHDLAEPFLRARDGEKIKNELKYFYDRYKYAIPLNHRKFNNAFSMVLAYQCKSEEKSEEMFLVGFLSKNVFYEKKEQEDSVNEN
jgi:CRISPR-associated protein Csh1